jgi:hypothetical protein
MGWVADLNNSLEKSGVDFNLKNPDDRSRDEGETDDRRRHGGRRC